MKRLDKKTRILTWIIIIIGFFFVTDMVCFHFLIHRPIFMVPTFGGEVIIFIGLGYSIYEFFPFTNSPTSRSYDVNIVPFVIIYTLLIAFLVFRIMRQRRRK